MLQDTTSRFDVTVRSALVAMQQGQFDRATKTLAEAADIEPTSPIPHYLLASNLAQEKRNDEAEAAYLASLSRNPSFGMSRFQLGLLQLVNGRAVTAQETWLPLLQLEGNHYLKFFVQGLQAVLAGDPQGGARAIQAGLTLNRENHALNKDMRGVLERLAGIPAFRGETTTTATPATDAMDHVLLASYRQS